MSGARGWWAALFGVLLALVLAYPEALAGRAAIDGAALLPYQDPVYADGRARAMPQEPGDPSPQLIDQPWDAFIWRSFAAGRLPAWQPYNGFGHPLMANAQAAPFNPLKLIGGAGVGWRENLFLIARLAVALAGVLALARTLGLGPWGGALAALAFGLGGFFAYHLRLPDTHVMALLPWLVLAAERLARAPDRRGVALFGLGLGLAGLAGLGETAAFAALGALAVVAAHPGPRGRRLAALAGGVALGMALAAAALWPFLELVGQSMNYHADAAASGMAEYLGVWTWPAMVRGTLRHLLQGDAPPYPYFYNACVGTAALAMIPWGLGASGVRRPALVLVACAVGLYLVVGPVGAFGWHLPGNSFYATPLLQLGLALLAGAGLERVLAGEAVLRRAAVAVGLAGVALVGAIALHALDLGHVTALVALLLAGVLGVAAWRRWPPAAAGAGLLALAALELAGNARTAMPPMPPFAYPSTPLVAHLQAQPPGTRVAGAKLALLPAANAIHRVEVLEHLEFFQLRRVVAFFGALNGPAPLNTCYGLDPTFRPELLDVAGVDLVLGPTAPLPHYPLVDPRPGDPTARLAAALARFPGRYRKEAAIGGVAIYRNTTALPRAEVYYAAQAVAPDAAAAMLAATPARWRQTALIEGPAPAGAAIAPTPATLAPGFPEQVEVQATATRPGWLVLRDAYYPGWHAYVDGQEAPIYPAFVAFRAVPVPAGLHRVAFRFEPASLRAGLLCSGLGLAMIALLLYPRRRSA